MMIIRWLNHQLGYYLYKSCSTVMRSMNSMKSPHVLAVFWRLFLCSQASVSGTRRRSSTARNVPKRRRRAKLGAAPGFYMSYGQYSWLITIKNGASHPMVQSGIYHNHYFWIIRILIMDGMTMKNI